MATFLVSTFRCLLFGLTLLCVAQLGFAADQIVKKIEIEGMRYSKPLLVKRELPFDVGDIWQSEYAEISERRLRNLGLFSEVEVSPPDAQGVVLIHARDRWSLWLLPEVSRSDRGDSTAGLALTEHNLWGLNHKLRLSTRWSTGKNFTGNTGNSYEGSYHWRRIANSNYGFDMTVNRGHSISETFQKNVLISRYLQKDSGYNTGISYGFGSVPGEGWDIRVGFAANDSKLELRDGIPRTDIENRRRQAIQISSSYRMENDHITWLTGRAFDYTLDVAHKSMGSSIDVYRHTASFRQHILFKEENTVSLRMNAGWATGDVVRDGLFDVGNQRGIRGYYSGDLQGSAYVYGTLENRMKWSAGSNVQWVAYVDAGHVSKDGKSAVDGAVVAGVGTGFRWTLRWLVKGTLRVDGAYGFATKRWRVHLGTGQAF
ncbi:MAG: hypothetical protein R8K22_08730 [Mariprofundaceae bacterium]